MVSTMVMPGYIDNNNQCFYLQELLDALPPNYLQSYYESQLPSFKLYEKTGNILLNETDFKTFVASQFRYADDIAHLSGRTTEQVMVDVANYQKNKIFVIQPSGISGVIHRSSNLFYLSGSITQTFTSVGTSHLSGVTGFSLLGSAPALAITLPLIGGVFLQGVNG